MQTPEPLLRTDKVTRRFGDFTALKDVDLAVQPGTLHAVIGPNGAGKTTLFNVLAGQLAPSAGSVYFDGEPVHTLPVHRRTHLGIGRSFQITAVFPELTVRENVRLAAQAVEPKVRRSFLRASTSARLRLEAVDEVLARVGLAQYSDVPAANLSHGLTRRLEIGLVLASGPRLLLLDEPLSGMGVDDIAGMEQLLRSLVPEHTVVLVEHNMPVTLAIADRVSVLVGGQTLVEGTPDEVAADDRVKDAYLGRGHL